MKCCVLAAVQCCSDVEAFTGHHALELVFCGAYMPGPHRFDLKGGHSERRGHLLRPFSPNGVCSCRSSGLGNK